MDNHGSFRVLDGFVRSGGTIDIGRFDDFECAAVAADPRTVWVVLVRRDGESLVQLLDRLERRLSRCLMHGSPYNELGRRQSRPTEGAARRGRQRAEPQARCLMTA